MKQSGYSLIEVLISSVIFAGVLIGVFTVFGTVNKASRSISENRDVSYAGFSFVDAIAELARYAIPSRTSDGSLACSGNAGGVYPGGEVVPQFPAATCQKGLIYDSTNRKLGINILIDDGMGSKTYQVYELSLLPHPVTGTYTKDSIEYRVYTPKLIRYKKHPIQGPDFYQVDSQTERLLPADVVILVPNTDAPFDVQEGVVIATSSDKITADEDLTLGSSVVGDTPPKYLKINLTFADIDEIQAGSSTVATYPFKTAISTRPYNISFQP